MDERTKGNRITMINQNRTTCVYCGRKFQTHEETIKHECTDHLHIDFNEYQTYATLVDEQITAFRNKNDNPNSETRKVCKQANQKANAAYKKLLNSISPGELAEYAILEINYNKK